MTLTTPRALAALLAAVMLVPLAPLSTTAPTAAAATAGVGPCSNGWQELYLPDGSFNDIPQGAVTRAGQLEWVVGGGHRGPMLLRWTGARLVAHRTGSPVRRGLADGIVLGPGSDIAGGYWRPRWGAEISPLLGRLAGLEFRREPVAISPRTNAAVADVVTLPGGSAWAVGSYLEGGRWKALSLLRQGTRWVQRNPYPNGGSGLLGVARKPGGGVWAVGWRETGSTMRPLVLKRVGSRWKSVASAPVPPGPAVLTDVAMPPRGPGWAIGYMRRGNGATHTPFLQSWDGRRWRRVALPWAGASAIPQSLHASASGELWIAGTQLATAERETRGFVAHRAGGAWTLRYIDSPPDVRSSLQSVDATSEGAVVTGTIASTALVLRSCSMPEGAAGGRKIAIAGIKKRRQARELHEVAESMPVFRPSGATQLAAPVRSASVYVRDVAAAAGLAEATRTYGATVADFDGNGWNDVLISRHQGAPKLALNSGGTFQDAPNTAFSLVDRHGCDAADADGNGWLDVLCITGRRYGTSIAHHELSLDVAGPSPRFDRTAAGIADPLGRGRTVTFIRLDRNAFPEAFVVNEPEREDVYPVANRFYRNVGGTFVSAPGVGLDRPVGGDCADGTDVDGDGDEDLLLCARFPYDGRVPGLRIYRNQAGKLLERSRQMGVKPIGDIDVAVADVNGDGRRDLVQLAGNRLRVSRRVGAGFRKSYEVKIDKAVAMAVGDVNGDGRADIYVVRGGQDRNRPDRLLLNSGRGTAFSSLAIPQVGPRDGRADDVVALDYDRNGLTDFVVLNGKGKAAGPIQLLAAFPRGTGG